MVLESNAFAPSPLASPIPTSQSPTSIMDTSWANQHTNSSHSTPSSRKRKLVNQNLQTYKTGNLMNITSEESDSFVETNGCASMEWNQQPTCHTVKSNYNSIFDSSGIDIKMEEDTQVNTLWTAEESEWPTILSCDLGYQSSSPQHAQSVTINNITVGRHDTHNLEKAEDTATPAYLDWKLSLQTSLEYNIKMDDTKTVADNDTILTSEYHSPSFRQYQCLDQYLYSDCITSRNTDTLTPSCLTLSSLEHIPKNHTSVIQQKQKNRKQQNNQSSQLSIDLSLLSRDQDSPTTPALFSPSFVNALDDTLSLRNNSTLDQHALPTSSSILPMGQYSSYNVDYSHHIRSLSRSSSLKILEEEEEDLLLNNQYQHQQPIHSVNTNLIADHSTTSTMYQDICTYLSRPDAVSSGELTVMISTTKVAQKSYGTEKRFICPPPSVVLIGTNWWTVDATTQSSSHSHVLQPPIIQIQMSNRSIRGELVSPPISTENIEWATQSGVCWNPTTALDNATSGDTDDTFELADSTHSLRMKEPIVSGRCIAKNMYISDSDDKQKTVEMMVRLQLANGLDLGVFKSKGIKVISKPSKKRQTLKNADSCIHHGSTVALFNRRRSQTVSTRYLCISNMDGTPVFYGNQQQSTWGPRDLQKEPGNVCFSAKTQTWDSFFIWIVDESPNKTTDGKKSSSWPPAPSMALQSRDPNTMIPIYYNQHVILQCITTGFVSPIMIIRKVGHGNTAIGGIRVDHILEKQLGSMGLRSDFYDECLGDPVSQLHKVAFQVIDDPTPSAKSSSHSYTQQQQQHYANQSSSTSLPYLDRPAKYLSCMNDTVGIYHTSGQRRPIPLNKTLTELSSPNNKLFSNHPSPLTTMSTPLPFSWPEPYGNSKDGDVKHEEYAYYDTQQRNYGQSMDMIGDGPPAYQKRRVSIGINDAFALDLPTNTCDLEHNKRSSTASRRRYSSANEQTRPSPRNKATRRRNSVLSSTNPSSSLLSDIPVDWQEDISDTCIWSIVGTDTITYSFWPSKSKRTMNKELVRPVAPIPSIKQCQIIKDNQMVIYGHGFTDDMVVWFGSCVSIMLRATPTELELLIPRALLDGESRFEGQEKDTIKEDMVKEKVNRMQILIVRERDGIVYRTRAWF